MNVSMYLLYGEHANLQKNVAPNTPQFKPVDTAHCFAGAFLRTAMVAPVVAPAKAIQTMSFNDSKRPLYC